jgi:Kef-type K+ transport system membrane component KefB
MPAALSDGLSLILVQIVVILAVTRTVGFFLTRIGQPSVVGEIIGGIILGPSLLGRIFPAAEAKLFPPDSLFNLQMLGQVGLILFMFVVGMEIDLPTLRKQTRAAIIIGHASIIFPFLLGLAGGYWLYPALAPPGISLLSWELFIGISVSITAFPVLARILQERGLTRDRTGVLAITCAAMVDVVSWCILAAVVAIVKAQSAWNTIFTMIFAAGFVLIMLLGVRPLLGRLLADEGRRGAVGKSPMVILFGLLLISATIAQLIGIHALFGAFLAGVVVPSNQHLRKSLVERTEYVSLILLLPLFFAYSGLRTQIGLLSGGGMWVTCLMITAGAIVGKFGGTALAARIMGENWKDSFTLGALMNTRGLVELVALNIGYDLGVLSPGVFTMLVIMALLTTFMTCPMLDLINRIGLIFQRSAGAVQKDR